MVSYGHPENCQLRARAAFRENRGSAAYRDSDWFRDSGAYRDSDWFRDSEAYRDSEESHDWAECPARTACPDSAAWPVSQDLSQWLRS